MTLEIRPSPHVTLPNLVILGQMERALEIHLKKLTPPRISGQLKVVGTCRDRSATFDFLLTFHSNHGPILYLFRDKRRFQSKIKNFSHPVCLTPPLKGFPLQFGIGAWVKNTIRLLGREKGSTISLAVWIQYTNVTDGQTDTGRQQRLRLRIASRGKKK